MDFFRYFWYTKSKDKMVKTGTSNAETLAVLRTENEALRQENKKLSQKLDYLMEQIRLAKKKAFGASSEKSSGGLAEAGL